MKDIFQIIAEYRMNKRKEREKLQKKFNSLSLVDRNAYEQIVSRHNENYNELITLPIKIPFYLGIFGLVMYYAFNINILNAMSIISINVLKLFIPCLIIFVILSLINEYHISKLKRKLLNEK